MIDVVLNETEFPGNVGAVCRVMKNFGFFNLIVVNPVCDIFSDDAKRRSKHAYDVLSNAKIENNFDFLTEYNFVIGTTAIIGTDYNIKRSPISLDKFVDFLNVRRDDGLDLFSDKTSIAVMFGSEGTGLRSDVLELCDYVLSIDTYKEYKTLNLSHAVAIVLYELFKSQKNSHKDKSNVELADRKTKSRLNDIFSDIVSGSYNTSNRVKTLKESSSKIFSKGIITKREAFALLGLFKKIRLLVNNEKKNLNKKNQK